MRSSSFAWLVFPTIAVLVLTPIASAALTGYMNVSITETGSIRGRSQHAMPESLWARSYALDITYVTEEKYGIGPYGDGLLYGVGEMELTANGTLRIELDDQGEKATLLCTLDKTFPLSGVIFLGIEKDGVLHSVHGVGAFDSDAWECEQDNPVHGSAEMAVTSVLSLVHGIEAYEAGEFPRSIAGPLDFVDPHQDWPDEFNPDAQQRDIIARRYVQAPAKMGSQKIEVQKTYTGPVTLASSFACPHMHDEELFGTSGSWSCDVQASQTLVLSRPGDEPSTPVGGSSVEDDIADSSEAARDGASSSSERDTPALALFATLALVALVAVVARRR